MPRKASFAHAVCDRAVIICMFWMQEQEPTVLEVVAAWISGKPQGMFTVGIFQGLYVSPLQKPYTK